MARHIRLYSQTYESFNFVQGLTKISMQIELRKYYPVLTKIIMQLSTNSGMLTKEIGSFISKVIEHSINLFNTMPKHDPENFIPYTGNEILSEVYPDFPIRFKRPLYSLNCAKQDRIAWKNMCRKTWKKPQALTPGIFLVVCACKNKSVYGFSMMVKSESPSFIFDIVTTRFDSDYRSDSGCMMPPVRQKSLV